MVTKVIIVVICIFTAAIALGIAVARELRQELKDDLDSKHKDRFL